METQNAVCKWLDIKVGRHSTGFPYGLTVPFQVLVSQASQLQPRLRLRFAAQQFPKLCQTLAGLVAASERWRKLPQKSHQNAWAHTHRTGMSLECPALAVLQSVPFNMLSVNLHGYSRKQAHQNCMSVWHSKSRDPAMILQIVRI